MGSLSAKHAPRQAHTGILSTHQTQTHTRHTDETHTHAHTHTRTHTHTHSSTFPSLATFSHSTRKVCEPPRACLEDTGQPPWAGEVVLSQPLSYSWGPLSFPPTFSITACAAPSALEPGRPKASGVHLSPDNSRSGTATS